MILTVLNNILTGATISANGVTGSEPNSHYDQLILFVNVRTVSAGTLTIQLQDSPDNVTWYNLGSSISFAAAGQNTIRNTNFSKYIRIRYTVAGGGTFSGVDMILSKKGGK